MLRYTARRSAARRALSLLELLLVVTVIGIIAAIVVPRVSITTQTSQDTVERHHLAQLNALVQQYYLINEDWPADLTDLVPNELPDGIPANPNGGTYTFNDTTNLVEVTP